MPSRIKSDGTLVNISLIDLIGFVVVVVVVWREQIGQQTPYIVLVVYSSVNTACTSY